MLKKLHDILVHLILGIIFLFLGNTVLSKPPQSIITNYPYLKYLYMGITILLFLIGSWLIVSVIFMVSESFFKMRKRKRTKIKFK